MLLIPYNGLQLEKLGYISAQTHFVLCIIYADHRHYLFTCVIFYHLYSVGCECIADTYLICSKLEFNFMSQACLCHTKHVFEETEGLLSRLNTLILSECVLTK